MIRELLTLTLLLSGFREKKELAGGRHPSPPPQIRTFKRRRNRASAFHVPGVGIREAKDKVREMKNTKFAKALVSSDRHTRDKTFERLRKWLCSQKSLDHLSMKKVWKALFYAMWHSDGREVQRELATSIASVMHSLKPQMAILYASVFFWTMRNEWAGIDKHRLDKYCVLARQMQKHVFQYMQRRDWETNVSQNVANRVYRDALFGEDDHITAIDVGIKLHVAEAFGEEIRRFDLKENDEKKKNKSKKSKKGKRSSDGESDSDDDDDKENVDVTDDEDDFDAGEAPPQEIIKMLLVAFMHGMRHETSFSFLKRCASDVFDVFCPTNVDTRNAPRNKNGWVLNATYIKDLARVAIELGAGNGCPETSREALYELHTDLKKATVVAEKAPSIELKRDQKLTIKVANRIMSEEKSSSSSSSSSSEEEDKEEKATTSSNKKKKKKKRAEIRVIDDEDEEEQPEKKKQKKNKKKAEKIFEENPFEKAQQEKHALAVKVAPAATEEDAADDDEKHPPINGHVISARRALNFKPKKYQDKGNNDSPSSSPSASPSKRLSWNLKGITRSFPSGAIDTSRGVQNIKMSTPTKGLLKPIHAIGKGSPSAFVKSKYFPGPPASAPMQRRAQSMYSAHDEDSDDDQREDHMILGIKKNNEKHQNQSGTTASGEKKKKKNKNKNKNKKNSNRRMTM